MNFEQKHQVALSHLAEELFSVQSTLSELLLKVEANGDLVDGGDKIVIRQQHHRINLVANALRNFVNQAY